MSQKTKAAVRLEEHLDWIEDLNPSGDARNLLIGAALFRFAVDKAEEQCRVDLEEVSE